MITCYLGLGSNLGSPERQLRQAIASLRKLPASHVLHVASFYPNEACGRKDQPKYCNTVVALRTSLKPHFLLKKCQKIEENQGRVRKIRWGARTLDIDILLFGSRTLKSPTLVVPHPRLYERSFVLIPLAEIVQRNYCF